MPFNSLRPGGFKDDQLLDPDLPRPVRYFIYALLVVGLLVAVAPTAVLLLIGALGRPEWNHYLGGCAVRARRDDHSRW
ncbi:MAG: hypothetical protein AVDCRST_MAG75-2472 [uncultured Propionibacteriaceae bacterium]|uniref:Uncharacterized protein n=1 Tax=uncultured Propionibacteriaceae bacterium TaxID=257457 RepID=A0A6J4P9K0_9ACTN|nr:MAG: hypothetical protein AVDCRST_MAG75-2472 [uncultured Propionibacteriaceae bacterium]